MAHTTKYTTPGTASRTTEAPVPVVIDSTAPVKFAPRVEALRKLVAAGQYQVSARHLAHQIMRSAGIKPI